MNANAILITSNVKDFQKAQAELGLPVKTKNTYSDYFHAWFYIPKKDGIVVSLNHPKISSHCDIHWLIQRGDRLQKSKHIASVQQIAATMIVRNKDYETLRNDFHFLRKFDFVTVEGT